MENISIMPCMQYHDQEERLIHEREKETEQKQRETVNEDVVADMWALCVIDN